MAAQSLTTLLTGIVDYAGLFPPASLSMRDAVHNYAGYVQSADAWMLARFIVPVSRLQEFEAEAQRLLPKDSSPWRISALAESSFQDDANRIAEFNARHIGVIVDAVELKASRLEEILAAALLFPKSFHVFVEIPIQHDPAPLVHAIGQAGLKAKVRTGGVTPDAFPSSEHIVRFLSACVSEGVQFKATAGLHHPVRSLNNLTYEANSEKAKMYGYLNAFLAASFLKNGLSVDDAVTLLEEENHEAFQFDTEGVTWRSHRLSTAQIRDSRTDVASSFGSCSFREPIDELKVMNLL